MMSYPAKEILKNFLSVLAGVSMALIIMVPVVLFAGLMVLSDASVPKPQEIISTILLIFGITAGCITGGYTTAKISTRNDLTHTFITGLLLTFLYALVNDFEFDWRYFDIGMAYFGFVPVVMIGGMLGVKIKRSTLNKHSSPSDNP